MTRWRIEAHNCAGTDLPTYYRSPSMADLRAQLQILADDREVGELHFRYELDDRSEQAVVVHSYFNGRNGRRRRFVRVRREERHAA